ncbi:MAG: hypothetical protein DWQ37_01940 [Planctomycetota bacterium]|nr:MAG: hypothetical protein DWQ37_01940 [Planctomycetota bacterium]
MVVTKNDVPLITSGGNVVNCPYNCCPEDDPPTPNCCTAVGFQCQPPLVYAVPEDADEFPADLPATVIVDFGDTQAGAVGATHVCDCPDCSAVDPCSLFCNPFEDAIYYEGILNACPGVFLMPGDSSQYDPIWNLGCCACRDDEGAGHGDPCVEGTGLGECVQLSTTSDPLPACSILSGLSLEFEPASCSVRTDSALHWTWQYPFLGTCAAWQRLGAWGSWNADGTCGPLQYGFHAAIAPDCFQALGRLADVVDIDVDVWKLPAPGAGYYWYLLMSGTHHDSRPEAEIEAAEGRIYRSEPLPVVDGCVLTRGTFAMQLISHWVYDGADPPGSDFVAHYGKDELCAIPETLVLHAS